MNKILFICPYFGILPSAQMPLWLKSCAYNPTIDWIIITDDRTPYAYPNNVNVHYMSFDSFKRCIQQRFNFSISLETPYKLCDYKPMYGYIFPHLTKGYNFWGHCDISDCIFGDIRKFITDELLASSDKFLFLGHMTIYRNTEDVNKRFMLKTSSGVLLRQIVGVKENKAFDELTEYSINKIYQEYGFPMCRIDDMYADVSPLRYSFQLSGYDEFFKHHYDALIPRIFEWKSGHLYDCVLAHNGTIVKQELGYVHFQKRRMLNCTSKDTEHFYVVPYGFVNAHDNVDTDQILSYTKDKLFYLQFFRLKYKALKYRLRHIWQEN